MDSIPRRVGIQIALLPLLLLHSTHALHSPFTNLKMQTPGRLSPESQTLLLSRGGDDIIPASVNNNRIRTNFELSAASDSEDLPLYQSTSSSSSDEESLGSSDNDNNNILSHIDNDDTRRRQFGMGWALSLTYFTVMAAKVALPSVFALLVDPKAGLTFSTRKPPQQQMAILLLASTLSVATGKVLLGPVVDYIGGITALKLALAILATLLLLISNCQHFYVFSAAWIVVDFIFSSCWAGCINAIHQVFPQPQWAGRIGNLAAAARTGNALAFALYASLLQHFEPTWKQPWRPIFALAAVIQVIPITLLSIYGKSNTKEQQEQRINGSKVVQKVQKPSLRQSLRKLKQEAKTPEFWLHLTSRSCLMLSASFLLFVPTLMNQVYQTSAAWAARTGAVFALGCLLSVTLGSSWYSRQSLSTKVGSLAAMMTVGTASSALHLAHMFGVLRVHAFAAIVLFFLWGFSIAIPFYVPPSLYALARGGTKSSATIVDSFDIVGFLFLAAFNGYVAGIDYATARAWIPTFVITTMCALVSGITLPIAVQLECKADA